MPTGFIGDGYTRTATIPAQPNLHDALTVKFRPLTVDERGHLFEKWDKLTPDSRVERGTKALFKSLIEWSLTDDEGTPIDFTLENCGRLTFELYNSLINLISGAKQESDEGN